MMNHIEKYMVIEAKKSKIIPNHIDSSFNVVKCLFYYKTIHYTQIRMLQLAHCLQHSKFPYIHQYDQLL